MEKRNRDERKLIIFTYILTIGIFANLSIISDHFDIGAVVFALVVIVLFSYTLFVIKKFFPDGDKHLLIFITILCVIGLSMLYRLDLKIAIRQVIWFAVGLGGFITLVVLLPDLKSFTRFKIIYLIGTIIFMAMATFIGREINGSKNWAYIGSFGFQPSEFAKAFLIFYLASTLHEYKSFKNLIIPGGVMALSLGFMLIQKDLGTVLLLFGIGLTMVYIATSKFRYVFIAIILSVVGAIASYYLFAHVRVRVQVWQDPFKDVYNQGWQVVQSLIAISSGGLLGSGLGNGNPHLVTFVESDFIFAGICEEFGMIMGFAIMIIFFLLFYRCMRAAIKAKDNFSRLLAVGFSAMIATQALVIIGGVVNAIPLTGITLPFVSYGGSSMLTAFFGMGIVQKISEDS